MFYMFCSISYRHHSSVLMCL